MKHTLLIMVLTALLTLCLISSAGAAINWDTLPTAPEMPATFNDAMAAYPGYSAYASDSTKELILSEGNETYVHDVALTYDLLGNPVSINVMEYEKTALGNQTRNVLFDVDGTVLSVVTSEYLSDPDFHSSKIVDAEGRRLSTGVAFREGDQFVEYTMDQNGTLQRTVYDGEDIITQSAAYGQYQLLYSLKGFPGIGKSLQVFLCHGMIQIIQILYSIQLSTSEKLSHMIIPSP